MEEINTEINSNKFTPMFEQYLSIKKDYPDALLFYRMGDFYELFFKDAEIAARELQLALTSRNPNAKNKIPMCGMPYHSVQNYLSQLIDKGYKVAICEQVEDPKQSKGLVKREVIRVHTPGTILEESCLEPKSYTFLGSFFWNSENNIGGFAWLDFSTGHWSGLHSTKENDLWQLIFKLAPRELILPSHVKLPKHFDLTTIIPVYIPSKHCFDFAASQDRILKAQKVVDLASLGLENKPELVKACGGLLYYAAQTQKQDMQHLVPFQPVILGNYLIIDEITERNLEIFRCLNGRKGKGTLWSILDKTLTPMGGRLLEKRLRQPWFILKPIINMQNNVEFFLNDALRSKLRQDLNLVYDLERLSTRISLNRTTPRDFVALRQAFLALPVIHGILTTAGLNKNDYLKESNISGENLPSTLRNLFRKWDNLEDYTDLLVRAVVDNPPITLTEGNIFKQNFNSELDELIDLTEYSENLMVNLLAKEQAKNNLPKLKLGFNKVFGYYFELSKVAAEATIPEYFIRKQTLSNAERFVTEELNTLEEKLLSAAEKRKALEYQLFQELRNTLTNARQRILYMADSIALLDYCQSLAEVARNKSWIKPELHTELEINIKDGVHPVVEDILGSAKFIPNDIRIDQERRLLIITGPNMSGKSTILRQTALLCLLAQIGSFVPATKAHIGLVDRIFSRVGASDNLAYGQSTFMVEMIETARILRQSTGKSLIILDEIGRGTSTFDGLAIAWAVVEELIKKGQNGIRTLFATHYHELTCLEENISGIHNMNVAIREQNGEIVFLRRLIPGSSNRSYGVEVAKLAGIPQHVVKRAKQILKDLETKAKYNQLNKIVETQQNLLPGFESLNVQLSESKNEKKQIEIKHPVEILLQDIDPNNLTPLQAHSLISEWKTLWGEKKYETT